MSLSTDIETLLVRLIEATASYCGDGGLERVRASDAFIPEELVAVRRAIEGLLTASENTTPDRAAQVTDVGRRSEP